MKFLIIVQDLRVSGTSEGIVSRSFIAKLRAVYPNSVIDVVYLKNHNNEDCFEKLPIDSILDINISREIPKHIKFLNKFYWRLFHKSLNEIYINKRHSNIIGKIDYNQYDHIFARSSGLEYETIRALKGLPILNKTIINFHDPYPVFWDTGSNKSLTNLELFRLKEMQEIVGKAKKCITPAVLLSEDLQHLYGSIKKFHTLPHQFCSTAFSYQNPGSIRKKEKKITISYHGAIQFARNVDIVLDAYKTLLKDDAFLIENTEFVLRLRGSQNKRLKEKYSEIKNIIILDTLNFKESFLEQKNQTDILIILENCSPHSNILVGKAPFVAFLEKPVLALSPERSEMRRIINNQKYIANCLDMEEITQKLKNLIDERLLSQDSVFPFGEYFEEKNFLKSLNQILE